MDTRKLERESVKGTERFMLTPLRAGGINSDVTLTGDTDHPSASSQSMALGGAPGEGGVWGKAPDDTCNRSV